MKTLRKSIILPFLLLIVIWLLVYSSNKVQGNVPEPIPDVFIQEGKIVFHPESKLLKKMELRPVKTNTGKKNGFKVIGQIIAMANKSIVPGDEKIDWVELDSSLSQKMNLKLHTLKDIEIGDAFGIADIPVSYFHRVKNGDKILINRYGVIDPPKVEGKVFSLIPPADPFNDAKIVFQLKKGQAWFSGVNCEVTFPTLQNKSVRIATTALLHEGTNEYVLREVGPSQFVPQAITIGEGTPDEVDVIEGLSPDDKVVMRGAILLKAVLHELLQREACSQ